MSILLYDLAGADERIRFSPYCWRTKMALLHKGLSFEAIPWCFTDKDSIAESGSPRVPVIRDGDTWVADSWTIAAYLDETYQDKPLMNGDAARTLSEFVNKWCDASVNAALRPLILLEVVAAAHEKDKAYFRESREALFGKSLEDVCADRPSARETLKTVLAPAEQTVTGNAYLGGANPCYADYALFGSMKWVHTLTGKAPLESGSALQAWFERLLDLHDGYARKAPVANL